MAAALGPLITVVVAVAVVCTMMIVVAAIVAGYRDRTQTADDCDYSKNPIRLHGFISLDLRLQKRSAAFRSQYRPYRRSQVETVHFP